jgi:hypothetical protein
VGEHVGSTRRPAWASLVARVPRAPGASNTLACLALWLQVEGVAQWLQDIPDPRVTAVLQWLGLPICKPQEAPLDLGLHDEPPGPSPCPVHGWRLRLTLKLLLLGALALKHNTRE